MFIKRLQMLNYRNYNVLDISLGPHVNVFMGDNAQGKTNILEGIYYCAFARSHRTSKDKELINISGGGWTAAYLNAAARVVNTLLDLGRSVGSSIRRAITRSFC